MWTQASFLLLAIVGFIGVFQIEGASVSIAPENDTAYQLFAWSVRSQMQQVEYKLNLTWGMYVDNVKYFNIPEFSVVNKTLNECFQNVSKEIPNLDPFCLGFISEDVQQLISDSKSELEACTNLTHSWELVEKLINKAVNASVGLDVVVKNILTSALHCVTEYSKSAKLKTICFNTALNSGGFNDAVALVENAYVQISGGNLLLEAEASGCQNAESFSLDDKCSAIRTEAVTNCVVNTSTVPKSD